MPFPKGNCHSLSHVRYTPHYSWIDNKDIDPSLELKKYDKSQTRFGRIIRDSQRYISTCNTKYIKSIFEIKTILLKMNLMMVDLYFSEKVQNKGLFSVLGSKIDNIFEILELLIMRYLKNENR